MLTQLLDTLIVQTKGCKMDMLKHFRDPQAKDLKAGSHRIELDEKQFTGSRAKLQPPNLTDYEHKVDCDQQCEKACNPDYC